MEFEEYLKNAGSHINSIQVEGGRSQNWPTSECFLGVPPNNSYGRNSLKEFPDDLEGLHICLGADCEDLIGAFAKSKIPSQLKRLSIGDSSYALGKGRNYERISKILGEIEFPNLKSFEYGVWKLFSNSHCLYGDLGDVTKLLNRMPKLERLSLYGNFELNNLLGFSNLKSLDILLDDFVTGINGGFLSQSTLNNLLNSEYPLLNDFFLGLECDNDQYGYKFSEHFLSGDKFPNLNKLEITGGFVSGEKERLLQSPIGTRPSNKYHLGDMSIS